MSNILFIHQNFPGQYKYLMPYLSRVGNKVIALGEEVNLHDVTFPEDLTVKTYPTSDPAGQHTHHYIRTFEEHIRKGQSVLRKCLELRSQENFIPDIICVHTGWGEGSFLRDVFPHAKIIAFCEYFYDKRFLGNIEDEFFKMDFDGLLRFRVQNATQLLSATNWDWGISPTHFQWSTYPDFLRKKISIIHDGIDTEALQPKEDAQPVTLPNGVVLDKKKDTVITFVSRNLEPYRGFHSFMRALPDIQKELPDAHIVIIGGDSVSYGRPAPDGTTYRELLLQEVGSKLNLDRVYFIGKLPYSLFIDVLSHSSVHVYLSYPFVLSWSLLESMSMELLLVASNTASVAEVVQDRYNGILCDFYNPQDIAEKIVYAHNLSHEEKQHIRKNARKTVVEKYDLKTVCLPKQLSLLNIISNGGIPKQWGEF
ncbi:MAG: glycosyltransferase [Desulfovibrionaceae bacterium]|nr:glycosyltransferase [Desulfovibrionaceae bacterium]